MQDLKINLGKINANKIRALISDLEFKGKSRKEHKSYLDYTTDEYKESETILTSLFGEIDEEVLNFLNLVCSIEINEDNYKEVMQELKVFSDSYQYKEVDLRKTKEELIKQRAEHETAQKKQEEETAKQNAEIKASGNLTHSEKISLGTKEIAKQIREKLKKIAGVKFSVTMQSYSGGSSISVYLMESNFKVIEDFKNLSDEAIFKYKDGGRRTEEQLKEMQEGGHFQLNTHYTHEEYNKDLWNNGVFLTEAGHKLFREVNKIVNYYNYDNSDIQSDYFNVNFYCHLSIGKWDKPYILNEAETKTEAKTEIKTDVEEITFKTNEEKNGLEIYFKSKPNEEIRNLLKSNGFRWGRFNRCWYKKDYAGLEAEIKKVLGVV